MKVISKNKRAYFDYEISKERDAGIVLEWHEVKSIKSSNINLSDSIAWLENKELRLKNLDVPLYAKTSPNLAPHYIAKRKRKLLLKSDEIGRIAGLLDKPWNVVVPLEIFLNKRWLIKLKLWVWKRKRNIEKKQILKERDISKQMQRDIKNFR